MNTPIHLPTTSAPPTKPLLRLSLFPYDAIPQYIGKYAEKLTPPQKVKLLESFR